MSVSKLAQDAQYHCYTLTQGVYTLLAKGKTDFLWAETVEFGNDVAVL